MRQHRPNRKQKVRVNRMSNDLSPETSQRGSSRKDSPRILSPRHSNKPRGAEVIWRTLNSRIKDLVTSFTARLNKPDRPTRDTSPVEASLSLRDTMSPEPDMNRIRPIGQVHWTKWKIDSTRRHIVSNKSRFALASKILA